METKFSATCLFVSLSSPFKTAYASPTHTTVFPKGTSVISQLSLSSRPSSINRELWDGVMRYCPNSPLPVMTLFWRFQGHWAAGVGCFRLLIILTLPGAELHKKSIRLAAWAAEHVILVSLGERGHEGQIGQVQVGVNVKGLADLAPHGHMLQAHEPVTVVHTH